MTDWPGTAVAKPQWPGTPAAKASAWPGSPRAAQPAAPLHDRVAIKPDAAPAPSGPKPLTAETLKTDQVAGPDTRGALTKAYENTSLPIGARVLAGLGHELKTMLTSPFEVGQQQIQRQRLGLPITPQDAGDVMGAAAGAGGVGESAGGGLERLPPKEAPKPRVEPPPLSTEPGVARNPEGRPIVPPGGLPTEATPQADPRAAQAGQTAVGKVADRVGRSARDVDVDLTEAFKKLGIDLRGPAKPESPALKAAENIDPRAAATGQDAVGKVADRVERGQPKPAEVQPQAPSVDPYTHPQKGESGETVKIQNPSTPTPEAEQFKGVTTFTPGSPAPKGMKPYTPPADWSTLPKEATKQPWFETPTNGLPVGSGALVESADGKGFWVVSPTNKFGGFENTLPKGKLDKGLSMQQNAMKEIFEETGLKVKITGHVGDLTSPYSKTRYYIAKHEAGSPSDMGWESQAVHWVPKDEIVDFLKNPDEKKMVADYLAKQAPAASPKPTKPQTPLDAWYQKKIDAWYKDMESEANKRGFQIKNFNEKARVNRAKKQGFDTNLTLYHGAGSKGIWRLRWPTGDPEPAVFVADDPKVASAYGGSGQMMELWGKRENFKTIDWKGQGFDSSKMSKDIAQAKAEGHDGLVIKNILDIGTSEPQTQYAFFKPGNLRSKGSAAFDPKVKEPDAHLLSAAGTPKDVLEEANAPQPLKEFVNEQDDRFFKLRQQHTADKAELSQRVAAMPEAIRNPETQKRFYKHMEGDPSAKLTPEEQALYDQYITPLKQEERTLFEGVKKIFGEGNSVVDLKGYDPEYARRIVKGKNRAFDSLLGDQGDAANPVGPGFKSRKTGSMEPRRFFTIENSAGRRKVVAIGDNGGLAVVENKKYTPLYHDVLRRGEEPPKGVGDKFRVDGEKWTIKQARTAELEEHTGVQYYQNAVANTMDNILRLRAVNRMIAETERIKNSPEFAQNSRPVTANDVPRGWKSPEMPLFRDRVMDPKLANVIDDFYGKNKGDLLEALSKINRFAVASLFWTPLPHMLNAGVHWTTARGWGWITPKGIKSLAVDGARAIREVVTQGPEYQRLLREGSGLVYGGVANQKFYETMMKRLGEDIKREPAKWDPIARVLGVGPSDLVKMLYEGSSRALWSVSDMFMLQRVFELERKGLAADQAIREAEKHIPNYRIPPEVLGSRIVASVLKEPALTEFSRYHYGMLKSYAHMARDLAVGTGKERFDAMGNIMATAVMMAAVWPVVNYGIQKLTGDKDLELGPKGSTTIPKDLLDLYNGNKDFIQVLSGLVTIAPVLRTGMEMFPSNMDWFTHKPIAEPDDMKHGRVGRVAAQEAEHVADKLVQPYGMINQKEGALKAAGKQALGLREKPKKWSGGHGGGNEAEDAAKRHARPRGLIEKGEDELEKLVRRYKGTVQ